MIVSYKLKGDGQEEKKATYQDTILTIDTLQNGTISQSIDRIVEKEYTYTDYKWDDSFASDYTNIIKPFADQAKAEGLKTYAVVGGAGAEQLEDLKGELGLGLEMYTADDILLKTIVRSNPGIVLWKDGRIVHKWHKKKLPSYEEVKKEFIK